MENSIMKKRGNKVRIELPEFFPTGHPREGQPTFFQEQINDFRMVNWILPQDEEIDRIYNKAMRGRKPTRVIPFEMTYAYAESGTILIQRPFLVLQKITIRFEPDNYLYIESFNFRKGIGEKPTPVCKIEIDCREVLADEVASNVGLKRDDFNALFFSDRTKPDCFEGYILHLTKSFRY